MSEPISTNQGIQMMDEPTPDKTPDNNSKSSKTDEKQNDQTDAVRLMYVDFEDTGIDIHAIDGWIDEAVEEHLEELEAEAAENSQPSFLDKIFGRSSKSNPERY